MQYTDTKTEQADSFVDSCMKIQYKSTGIYQTEITIKSFSIYL